MSYCDFDGPKVSTSKEVKAAKDHVCCECCGTIRKGERHNRYTGVWEDTWDTYRTCPDCAHIRCELSRMNPDGCSGYIFGNLIEDLEELAYQDKENARRLIGAFNATSAARGGKRCRSFDE